MKTLKLLLIAVPLLLMSCSNDDASDVSSQLLGTWVGTNVEASGTFPFIIEDEEITVSITAESFDVDYTITFSENPNLLTSQGTYGLKVTTTAPGEEEVVENQEGIPFIDDDTTLWSRDENELTIGLEDEPIVYTISELTADILVLTANNRNQDGLNSIGNSNTVITYSFVKQ